MTYLVAYISAALVMGCLDFAWLSATVTPIYHRALGAVMADKPNMIAAVAFYLVYLVGVMVFAVRPALVEGGWRGALVRGALFGFFAYATYDLTNLATLKVWSLRVSLIDMAWGTVLTGVTATVSTYVAIAVTK